MIVPFSISRLPQILFGEGSLQQLPSLAASFGRKALLVTGARSFQASPHWFQLIAGLEARGLAWEHLTVEGEPSPRLVDVSVQKFKDLGIQIVVGIGGGSVLDAGKAIAGLLPHGNSVMDHLEGVGPERPYQGPAIPYIAAPTTAGTGSEATKNAVLSSRGAGGFKKSFRHELLVPQYAVVDPALLASCPATLIASNGMDAVTQLLEAFVSPKANAFTDALALDGLRVARDSLPAWYEGGTEATQARSGMAYAALLSGICLAQAGLGAVHGLASPLGAFFPIPHGVVCGTLVAAVTSANIQALRARAPEHHALAKYSRMGSLLSRKEHATPEAAWESLVEMLEKWTRQLRLPSLSAYGVSEHDFDRIIANCRGGSMKSNPIVLDDDELRQALAGAGKEEKK